MIFALKLFLALKSGHYALEAFSVVALLPAFYILS